MDIFNIPDVTISVSRYTELVRAEKTLEKLKEYILSEEVYISKDMLMFLADLETKDKESADNE